MNIISTEDRCVKYQELELIRNILMENKRDFEELMIGLDDQDFYEKIYKINGYFADLIMRIINLRSAIMAEKNWRMKNVALDYDSSMLINGRLCLEDDIVKQIDNYKISLASLHCVFQNIFADLSFSETMNQEIANISKSFCVIVNQLIEMKGDVCKINKKEVLVFERISLRK